METPPPGLQPPDATAAARRQRFSVADTALKVGVVTVEWVALFQLNTIFLSRFDHSAVASWIFLPAALRVMAILLFGWAGAAGLVIGAFLTLPELGLEDLAFEVALALTSGISPWIAITACQRYLSVPSTLSDLKTTHIIAASVAAAVANSALINTCSALFGRWHGDLQQLAAIVVGDIVGAAILLGLIVLFARLINLGKK